MITAKFEYSPKIGFISMAVNGHAGFAELGKDPVCAGASILAVTVATVIKGMEAENKLEKKANIISRGGRVVVTAKPKPEFFTEAFHAFYVGETGMQLLAASYPKHIDFTPFVAPDEGDNI